MEMDYNNYIITIMQMECKNCEQDLEKLSRMITDTGRIYQVVVDYMDRESYKTRVFINM